MLKNFYEEILKEYNMEGKDIGQVPPLILAYAGDAVYEVFIRTMLVCGEKTVFPVKTSGPIPKGKIGEVMGEIKRASAKAPVYAGQVIIGNVAGTGRDIVAASEAR
jgi:CxxC motif-containing protein